MNPLRTDSTNKDFIQLVSHLDKLLAIMNGRDHDFYNQYNKIDLLQHVVLVFEGTTAVACGAIKKYDSDTMEVKRMFTLNTFRGKGYATQVLKELEKWAWELGYKKCILETGEKLPEAIKLYRKNAYKQIANYGQYAEIKESICFAKNLSGIKI